MPDQEKIVLPTDPEAATYRTNISGWVDRHGRFYGEDERLARYGGSTHSICGECGATTTKSRLVCHECSVKKDNERFLLKEQKEWDRKTPLYSRFRDRFIWNEDDLDYELEELEAEIGVGHVLPETLELVICEPQYAHEIDEDYFSDVLPEEQEAPDELKDAIQTFNEATKAIGPLSWTPGKYRAIVTNEAAHG
jgi:hypothetical protein